MDWGGQQRLLGYDTIAGTIRYSSALYNGIVHPQNNEGREVDIEIAAAHRREEKVPGSGRGAMLYGDIKATGLADR
jgi:hypothetical protein